VLKLITIRRQGTIAVLGRNLAVRVLMEKTAQLESRDTTINDVDLEGTATEDQVAQVAANIPGVNATFVGPARPAPREVRLFDQFCRPQIANPTLAVERSTRSWKSSLRPGLGLFERQDPTVMMEGSVAPRCDCALVGLRDVNAARSDKK